MARRLPPLNALRAFEAAARHESFSRAAEELSVTHAAISHQVRALEEWLGVALFDRSARAVRLSGAGRTYLPVIEAAFDRIHAGTAEITGTRRGDALHVTTTPAFAVRWLAPRLGRLWQAHPDLDLRLHQAAWLSEVDFSVTHVAVRIGSGKRPGLVSVPLMPGTLTPMCSPALLGAGARLERPADLVHFKLLHLLDYRAWRQWFELAGIDDADVERGPIFDDTNLVYSAAIAGQGVGLLHTALTRREVAAGQLVRPFADEGGDDLGYCVVYPPQVAANPLVAAFRDWLIAEARDECGESA
ncbi:MAG: transcriptional regulator GcvA [Gammaproteobacteria bacterium]|nr:transcriptional regulator GcvA [Gammaproteobacteria bacterium]